MPLYDINSAFKFCRKYFTNSFLIAKSSKSSIFPINLNEQLIIKTLRDKFDLLLG
jgi:hypothetical protein